MIVFLKKKRKTVAVISFSLFLFLLTKEKKASAKATPAKEKHRAPAVDELTPSCQLQLDRLQLGADDEKMETEEAGAGAAASWYDRTPPIPLNLATPPQWKQSLQAALAFTPSILVRGTATPKGAAPFMEPAMDGSRGERTPAKGLPPSEASASRQSPLFRAALERSRPSHTLTKDDVRRRRERKSESADERRSRDGSP